MRKGKNPGYIDRTGDDYHERWHCRRSLRSFGPVVGEYKELETGCPVRAGETAVYHSALFDY